MRRIIYILIFTSFTMSCSDFGRIVKLKNNNKLKYDKAVELYNKKDYTRALTLLEQLREVYRGNDSMEYVYYYTAYANYGIKDFDFASLYFKDFTENFTNSPHLIECAYMHVYCQYLAIGSYELDQSNTVKAIGALQAFINYYPNSPYAEKCNAHLDILRKKQQQKQYEIVQQYYHMADYRAAVVSARLTLKNYPDIDQKEELELLTVKAQYFYALNSVDKKRLERMYEARENWKEYNYINHNTGKYFKDAEAIKSKIDFQIKKLKENI